MTTEKKTTEMVTVNFNGQEMDIPKDGRLHKQIQNLVEKNQEEKFSDKREMFTEAVTPKVLEQMNGFEEVLEGMTLIFDFAKDAPILVRTGLVKIGKREGKAAA